MSFDMIPSLAVGVLTCNRLELLNDTLNSLFSFNPNIPHLVLVDSDSSVAVQRENRVLAAKFGMRYVLNDPSFSDNKDERIEHGVRRLIKEVLRERADMCCLMQDDWRCLGSIPVETSWEFLNRNANIGQVRMRDFKYDDTFDGGSSVNFVTHRKIEFERCEVVGGTEYAVGELHWVDSCNLMLPKVLGSISGRFNSEIERMEEFHRMYPHNAQLRPGVFHHTGPRRIRHDLRERGLFGNANIS